LRREGVEGDLAVCGCELAERVVEAVEQLGVAPAVEGFQHCPACPRALPLERTQQASGRFPIDGVERGRLAAQASEQDVEVSDFAEDPADPFELEREHLRVRLDQRLAGAKQGPGPPDCHSHVVQALRIGSKARAGIVCKHRVELLAKSRAQRLEGRRGRRARLQLEHSEELGGLIGLVRARPLERFGDLPQPRRLSLA
jgi:hypothetical protein